MLKSSSLGTTLRLFLHSRNCSSMILKIGTPSVGVLNENNNNNHYMMLFSQKSTHYFMEKNSCLCNALAKCFNKVSVLSITTSDQGQCLSFFREGSADGNVLGHLLPAILFEIYCLSVTRGPEWWTGRDNGECRTRQKLTTAVKKRMSRRLKNKNEEAIDVYLRRVSLTVQSCFLRMTWLSLVRKRHAWPSSPSFVSFSANSWVGFDTGEYQFYCFPSLKLVDHTKEFR